LDKRQHIVVVEDEAAQRQLLLDYLSRQGFRVTGFESGAGLRRMIEREMPALVLLDVGLPGEDGFAVARWLREKSGRICIIMVTAAGDTVDRVVGLETGADDYLPKPISVRELKARVNAMFRRPRRLVTTGAPSYDGLEAVPDLEVEDADVAGDHEVLRHGDLLVDVDAHRVWCAGAEIDLTPTEFDLLTTLMRAPTRVWSRSLLMQEVWGQTWGETHHVEVHMGNLRRKLGDRRGQVRFVETVRGVGYRLRAAS
jgi:DNA-binding response OmpR family regulator